MSELPPLRVEPLDYHLPQSPARPGVLTAVGVVSIGLASFGILASCAGMINGIMFSRVSSTLITTQATRVTPATSTTLSATAPAATIASTPTATTTLMPNPFGGGYAIYSIVDGVVGLILAIVLLIAGINTLRNSTSSRKLHLVWAVLRIIVAAGAAAIFPFMARGMFANFANVNGPSLPAGLMTVTLIATAVVQFILGAAYPIVLLCVLNTQSIRAFFESLRAR